jgi:hypothetical protein
MPLSLLPMECGTNTSWTEAPHSVAPLSAARIAAIFDLHGRCAYSLAMLILGNPGRAEAATEEAFRALRYDEKARDEAGQLRTRLLQLVYAAAVSRVTKRPSLPLLHPAALINALPSSERQALALCLHGVTCAALDAAEDAPTGSAALQLHRALKRVRSARSAVSTQ